MRLHSTRLRLLAALSIAAGPSLGCAAGVASATSFVCNEDAESPRVCVVVPDVTAADEATIASGCSADDGVQVAACPTDNLLGCCHLDANGLGERELCYYAGAGGPSASELESACAGTAERGAWTVRP